MLILDFIIVKMMKNINRQVMMVKTEQLIALFLYACAQHGRNLTGESPETAR